MFKESGDCLRCYSRLAGTAVLAGLLLSTTAVAQVPVGTEAEAEASGDIIVTAQRRAERLQSVPIAITAISSESIANQGIANLEDLATSAPSLNVVPYPNSSDTLTLTMRGQGAGDVGQVTRDGGVGVYVDGFYISRPQGALLDIGDPERIEVLRGPQGTLYGRNTTGGAVNFITKKPTGEWGGSASLSFGSRYLVRSVASIDLPAIGNLAIRGSIVYTDQDGWVKNPGAVRDYGEFGQIAGRVAARWTPTEDLTVDYAWDQGRLNTTQLYYIKPSLVGVVPGYFADRDRTYAPLDIGNSVSTFVDHQLAISYDLSEDLTIRSLSAYRGFRADQSFNYGVALSSPAFAFNLEGTDFFRTRQFTQELQLIGSLTDRLDFAGGLFYFRERGHHNKLSDLGFTATQFDVRGLSKSLAAYMQSTWNLPVFEEKLKLTVGGRYTRDSRSAVRDFFQDGVLAEDGVSNRLKFSDFSPMANLAFQWTPEIMSYVKYSKAYKAGGSAEGSPNFSETFGPEKVTAWEAGIKSQLFDRMLTLNVTGFYNKFNDLQFDFVVDPVNTAIGATYNAGRASLKGIEIESSFRPARDFGLRGSFSYMKQNISFIEVIRGTVFDGPFQVGDNLSDRFVLPFVPKFAWSVGGDWTFVRSGDDEVSLHATYAYQSRVYATAAAGPNTPGRNFSRNDPLKNLDARIKWMRPIAGGKALSLSLFADNLLNNRRDTFPIGTGGGLGGFTDKASVYNEPRTIGGEVKVEF